MKRIYLDHNASTPVREEVKQKVIPFLGEMFGNPSSRHKEGRVVRVAVENAREEVARTINASSREITFTSGATEGNNAVLRGYWQSYKEREKKNHIITTAIEHPCVLTTSQKLKKEGFDVTFLPVDSVGRISLDELEAAIRPETGLVSIMMINNETGNIYPIERIGEICQKHNVLLHVDAAQAVGKVPVDVKKMHIDFLTLSGHKFYALKGAGAMYTKWGRWIKPLMTGGHQEKNRRSGTENIVGIIAIGEALKLARDEMDADAVQIKKLRDYFEKRVLDEIPYTQVLGDPSNRIYTTTNISFKFIEGEGIILKLDVAGIAVSTGSACSSGSLEPSHVITSMNVPLEDAHSSTRFSLGKQTTKEDLDYTVDILKDTIATLRSYSPLYDEFMRNQQKGE
ncbi:cysteine desulfurase [bacterium]|nr:cysteine desulfurase [bacterium]